MVFDEMIGDIVSNTKYESAAIDLFIRRRKHYFFMKILSKKELQQITVNHS